MHISRMDPSVEPFVRGETFTHYAVAFYSPKWTGESEPTVEPGSEFDQRQFDDLTRFATMVNGDVFRWSGRDRADMAKNDTNHRFFPVGAAWTNYMLIVGFDM